jgi:hypothetical protein
MAMPLPPCDNGVRKELWFNRAVAIHLLANSNREGRLRCSGEQIQCCEQIGFLEIALSSLLCSVYRRPSE